MTLNILAISFDFYPSTTAQSIQVTHLLRHISSNICIVTGQQSDCTPAAADPLSFDKVEKIIYNIPLREYQNTFFSICNRRGRREWIRNVVRIAQDEHAKNQFRLVLGFGQPWLSLIAAYHVSLALEIPLISHFSDPWSLSNFYPIRSKLSFPQNYYTEKRVIARSSLCIYTNQVAACMSYRTFYKDHQAYPYVIGHSSSIQSVSATTLPACNNPSNRVIRYVGSFYGSRTPKPLLKLVTLCSSIFIDNNVSIEIYGASSGLSKDYLHMACRKYPFIKYYGMVSHEDALVLQKTADGLLLIDANISPSPYYPSKLADYLACARPILGIVPNGASEHILNGYNHFTILHSDHPKDKYLTLKRFISSILSESYSCGVTDTDFFGPVSNSMRLNQAIIRTLSLSK